MATMEEIREALEWVTAARGSLENVTVLHCTSIYPAPDETLNLRAMVSIEKNLGVAVGYSDHSLGTEACLAAVALGARVVEKHLTLDRTLCGPDHAASLEPEEFRQMVTGIRRIESMLGDGVKAPLPDESDTRRVARRSIVAACDITAGQLIEASMLTYRRPAVGILPRDLQRVLGSSARQTIAAGTVLQWEHLEHRDA